jgi:hypothetical protein
MKPAILTAAAFLLVALCAPVVQADDLTDSSVQGVNPPPIIVKPYCDPKNRDPDDDLQPTYCGAWSAYYVVVYFIENASVTDPAWQTVRDGRNAAELASECALHYFQNPDCPWKIADAL